MKISKRVALVLPILFLLVLVSVSYANSSSNNIVATVTVLGPTPVIVITSPVNKTTYNKEDVPLKFTINVPVVWIGYSLDNTKNKTIKGNTSLEGLKNGAHNITVYATDKSGNTGASNKVYFFYCLGDVNGDKRINWSDLLLVLNHFGQNCKSKNYNSNYDMNDDCKINIADVLIVLRNFGKTCR